MCRLFLLHTAWVVSLSIVGLLATEARAQFGTGSRPGSRRATGIAVPPRADATPSNDAQPEDAPPEDERLQIRGQQLALDVSSTIDTARNQMAGDDPGAALNVIKQAIGRVSATTDINPDLRQQLLKRLDAVRADVVSQQEADQVRLIQRQSRRSSPQPRQTDVSPVALDAAKLKEGLELFHRDWLQKGKLQSQGDGLGPMFNARSCAECHKSGAPGGGAANDHNVDLLSLEVSAADLNARNFTERVAKVHPGFSPTNTSVIVHAKALSDEGLVSALYDDWRKDLMQARKVGAKGDGSHGVIAGMKVRYSQRNTPALFGAGLIDALPDHMLVAIADEEEREHRDTAGRVARAAGGQVGRFGWRGQMPHLHDFVLAACANELGLQVPGNAQPPRIATVVMASGRKSAYIAGGKRQVNDLDLTAEQCLSLTAFCASLLPPTRSSAASVTHARDISAGEELFADIGCVQCHRRQIGPIDGIYSDLLLHDMGPELADPVAAIPDNGGVFGNTLGSYYGSTFEVPTIASSSAVRTNTKQEWRTPPLWGVADSGPYLHDGRAATLEDAIREHAGQGRRSARQFFALGRTDRLKVLEFLASLAAPRIDGVAPGPVQMTPQPGPFSPFGPTPGIGAFGGFFSVK